MLYGGAYFAFLNRLIWQFLQKLCFFVVIVYSRLKFVSDSAEYRIVCKGYRCRFERTLSRKIICAAKITCNTVGKQWIIQNRDMLYAESSRTGSISVYDRRCNDRRKLINGSGSFLSSKRCFCNQRISIYHYFNAVRNSVSVSIGTKRIRVIYIYFVAVTQSIKVRILENGVCSELFLSLISQAVVIRVFVFIKYSVAIGVIAQRIIIEPVELGIVG